MLDVLPSDAVVRILLNLPIKDVIRSTLLHKSIYSLVHSKLFINTYNQYSLLHGNNPPLLILHILDRITHQPKYSLRYCNAGLEEYMPLQLPFQHPWLSISNCCNSLVCLFSYGSKSFVLWNPYIGKTLTLPEPKFKLGFDCFLGLGFVNETSDYKVLIVDDRNQAELYSLQHNSWKIIAHPGPGPVGPSESRFCLKNPVYVKGSLYWIRRTSYGSEKKRSVVGVFDFKEEVFSDISLPDGWQSESIESLRSHTESSIAVVSSYFHTRVMDVNEKKWKRYFTAPSESCRVKSELGFIKEGEEIVINCKEFGTSRGYVEGIGVHRNGSCMIAVKHALCVDVSFNYVCNLALLNAVGENPRPAFILPMLKEEIGNLNS